MKKKSKSKKKWKSSRRTKKGKKRNQASFRGSRKRDDVAVIHFNEYDIVYDPMDDEYSALVPPEIEKEISVDLYLLAGDNPRKAIHRLKELRLQYPEHPRIYNYLAKAYSYIRDSEKMIERWLRRIIAEILITFSQKSIMRKSVCSGVKFIRYQSYLTISLT